MKRFSHYLTEGSHSFKDWVDPWAGLPPDVRKRVHRLTLAIFKAIPGSPKQRELAAERDGLLKKHGVWKPAKAKLDESTPQARKHSRSSAADLHRSRLESFAEHAFQKNAHFRTIPPPHAWLLAEPPKGGSGWGSSGKHQYHGFVPDPTDANFMYHIWGFYWWNASSSGWWVSGSLRMGVVDARSEWDERESTAVATGKWTHGAVTLIRHK